MGVREELEALRNQGITSKNANDLKDAVGLSTPEAEANAIRAEQERNRLANYGKEADQNLKSYNEAKTKMSTNPFDDEKSSSKDLTDMIQITNEFAFAGGGEATTGEGSEAGETPDCFLGKGCPIDPEMVDKTKESIQGAFDEHVKPKVEEATQSIKGAFDEHVVPKVDGAKQTIQGALDEHVLPKVDGATKSIRGALEEHVAPKIEGFQQTTGATVDTIKTKSMETIDMAKQQSIRGLETVQAGTQHLLGEVQTASGAGVEWVKTKSAELSEHTKTAVGGASARTMELVEEGVRPRIQSMVEASDTALKSTGEVLSVHAPVYAGTAPGWTGLTSPGGSPVPWYFVLLEATLRAFGRVVFCDNPATGICILLGILVASPLGAFCALLGVLTVNGTALYLDMDQELLLTGQYARNAVLVGTFLVDSFEFDFPEAGNLQSGVSVLVFLSIALALVTLLIESIWVRTVPNGVPSLLLPANMVLLATVLCAKVWNLAMITQVGFQSPADGIAADELEDSPSGFSLVGAVLNGLARIFFVDGCWFAGILILAGVLLCSRIVASSLLAGAFVASFVLGYMVFEENHWFLDAGYAGCNPALVAAGIFFYLVPSWKLTGLALFGIVAAVIVQGAVDVLLGIVGAPVSTSFGFCLTLLPLLYMDLGDAFGHKGEPDYFIRAVPKSELSTPEDYLKSVSDSTEHPTDSSSSDEEDPEAPPPTNEETPLLSS